MSEPTVAAMRAADRVLNHLEENPNCSDEEFAREIDLQTGLPELIAACREAQKHIPRHAWNVHRMLHDALRIAREGRS